MAVRPSARAGLLAIILLLAGCGLPTPSHGPRPALPRGVPFPVAVEDVVEELEQQLGRDCIFSPESGTHGEWSCGVEGGGLTLVGAKVGALMSVDTYIHEEDQSPDFMDRLAAEQFRAILAAIVPADVLPSEAELTEAVQANWPTAIGDGWILDFNGNDILRVLIVRYLEPGG